MFRLTSSIVAIAFLVVFSVVSTVNADTLTVLPDNGGLMTVDFNNGIGVHPFVTSDEGVLQGYLTLSGPATYLYCVDLSTTIGRHVSGGTNVSYAASTTTNGTVTSLNTTLNGGHVVAPFGNTTGLVSNAEKVAWLLVNIHPADLTQALALQASIWKAEYGSSFDLLNSGATSPTTFSDYGTYNGLLGSNTSPLNNGTWISPANSFGVPRQGLVQANPVGVVPEPSSFLLTMLGVLGALVPAFRKFRRAPMI